MQFLADAGIGRSVAQALALRGYAAVHLADEQLQHLTDLEVLEKARVEDRVVLTHDLDFSRLLALSGASAPSAISFGLSNMRPENVLAHLINVLDVFAEELAQGAIVSVGDRTSRCRSLPIGPGQ